MIRRVGTRNVGASVIVLLALSAASARAANVSGHWQVTITTSEGTISGEAAFKQTGQAVTGWLGPSADDPIPVSMVLKGNKLTITTHPQPGRTVAFHTCEVIVGADKMTGKIDTDKGTIEFVKTAKGGP